MNRFSFSLCFIVVVLLAAGPWLAREQPVLGWLLSLAFLMAFMLISGYSITGKWLGALIDDRNVISLARFQMAVWTGLLLSAFLATALLNLSLGQNNATEIHIAKELWALMGISSTSLVASPLILSTKENKDASAVDLELLNRESGTAMGNRGQVVVNREISQAHWSDMFTGEEVGNARHLDLSRIQMFFFTVVTAVTYGGAIAHYFWSQGNAGIHALPSLDASMIALIGISHTGYLAAKAVPRGQRADLAANARAVEPELAADLEPPPMG